MQNLFVGSGNESVKDNIIRILSYQWPLSAKNLYRIVITRYKMNVTYQAVHKALVQLQENKVVIKTGKQFSINIEWLDTMKGFAENVKTSYLKQQPLLLPGTKEFKQEGETQIFIFETLSDAEDYRKKLQIQFLSNNKESVPYVSQVSHAKSPIFYSERSTNVLNMIKKTRTPCYIIVRGRSSIDEWCADFYRNDLVKVKTGCDCAENCDTMVIGDIIVQTYIPKKIADALDTVYTKIKKISLTGVPQLYNSIYKTKAPVKIVVYKNPEIADRIRRETAEYFNNLTIFNIDTLVKSFLDNDLIDFLSRENVRGAAGLKKIVSFDQRSKLNSKLTEILERKDGEFLCNRFVSEYMKVYDYSKNLVNTMKQHGKVVAVSETPFQISTEMKKFFGFDEVLTTDGNKEAIFSDFLQRNNTRLDRSFAFGKYADDLPILKVVAHPVVLNPDKELSSIARKKSWRKFGRKDDIAAAMKKTLSSIK